MPGERAIPTVDELRGVVSAPPSKSVMQRALVAAGLAAGRSVLRRPLLSDDPRHLITALNAAGIPAAAAGPDDEPVVNVDGQGGRIPAATAEIFVGNAGTAMRFLTAVLAAGHGSYVIDGDARMRQRPIEDLLRALGALGASAASIRGDGCPPVRVGGSGLPGGACRLRGGKSSQYVSAILLAAPASVHGVDLAIDGALVSRPYVSLTIDTMRRFGVEVRSDEAAGRFTVPPGCRYRPCTLLIEGDYSSASYFFAMAAICGGRIEVTGLEAGSCQGDARFPDLLQEMGCRVERGAGSVTVEGGSGLCGIDADLATMPDVAPTLAVAALFARGPTRIRGVPHLRLKETDRIAALVSEIRRLGGDAVAEADGLTIRPRPLNGARIETYGDHRMAMAFAVAGLRVRGVVIADPGSVGKSFPDFWTLFDGLIGSSR